MNNDFKNEKFIEFHKWFCGLVWAEHKTTNGTSFKDNDYRYKMGWDEAWDYQQSRIDELQGKLDKATNTLDILEQYRDDCVCYEANRLIVVTLKELTEGEGEE